MKINSMYYIQSNNTDPYYNLALEQYVFDKLDRSHSYFLLWQNHDTIVIGKNQNTIEEINAAYVKEHGITVARRLSGGGAVYHDLGNLCFTFIADDNKTKPFDFALFCKPIAQALNTMDVPVEISGRNDMTIVGKKFSGNAQYMKEGRIMHHGTILFDSNLQMADKALQVSKDKIESKGIKSVKSRITNIKPYLKDDISVATFWDRLKDYMYRENDMRPYTLTDKDDQAIRLLRDTVYSQWDWNYGVSPAYATQKSQRIEGCGKLEIYINVSKHGIIEDIAFYGDYFGNGDSTQLTAKLKGCRMEESTLR